MPGFQDTTFIVLLALLLFGPKKLPVLARQLGKLMADFRRASNEFKIQMEEELRISEQADRQKQIAAIEAAAPRPTEPIPEPEHPHLPPPITEPEHTLLHETNDTALSAEEPAAAYESAATTDSSAAHEPAAAPEPSISPDSAPAPEVLPIASSGDLTLMPPATGLPLGRGPAPARNAAPAPESDLPTQAPELQTIPQDQHADELEASPWTN